MKITWRTTVDESKVKQLFKRWETDLFGYMEHRGCGAITISANEDPVPVVTVEAECSSIDLFKKLQDDGTFWRNWQDGVELCKAVIERPCFRYA